MTKAIEAYTALPGIPPEFSIVQEALGTRLVIRKGILLPTDRSTWERWIGGMGAKTLSDPGGRAPVYQIEVEGVGSVVLRRYHHGGLLRNLLRDRFVGVTRFLGEMIVSEWIREKGVDTPEVLALRFVRGAGPIHRGWVLTRHVPNGMNLRKWVESGIPANPQRRQVLRLVARCVATLHASGCIHGDLNLSNLLLASNKVFVLDLDGAWLEHPASLRSRGMNLLRLYRSLSKQTGVPEPLSIWDRRAFMKSYCEKEPRSLRSMWEFLSSRWCRSVVGRGYFKRLGRVLILSNHESPKAPGTQQSPPES